MLKYTNIWKYIAISYIKPIGISTWPNYNSKNQIKESLFILVAEIQGKQANWIIWSNFTKLL